MSPSFCYKNRFYRLMPGEESSEPTHCLIALVRRAWTGDSAAAIHVANIVGKLIEELKTNIHQSECSINKFYCMNTLIIYIVFKYEC